MIRKRMGLIAAAVAAGALTLTACGTSTNGQAAQAPSPSASVSAAANSVALQAPAQNLQVVPGTAEANNAPANTGDLANPVGGQTTQAGQAWVQLSASKVGNLDPVVVNGAGFTLYRFDADSASPSKATCDGACAAKWPPVIVDPSGKLFLDGVDMKNVGAVKRDDGTMQLTIGGWPVYRFSGDLEAGQANGQGIDGTWFGVTPTGGKAGAGPSGASPSSSGGLTGNVTVSQTGGTTGTGTGSTGDAGTASGGGAATGSVRPATNAVLFDDKGFASGAQGVSGTGCQNIARPKVASSIQTDGSLKIWSGTNCTGTSAVITGSVQDLSTINFDNKIQSVRFS
jgi:predicted lipoprotein with Yx(FWY)xxD motif